MTKEQVLKYLRVTEAIGVMLVYGAGVMVIIGLLVGDLSSLVDFTPVVVIAGGVALATGVISDVLEPTEEQEETEEP